MPGLISTVCKERQFQLRLMSQVPCSVLSVVPLRTTVTSQPPVKHCVWRRPRATSLCAERSHFHTWFLPSGKELAKNLPKGYLTGDFKVTLDDIILTLDGFIAIGTPLFWLSRRRSPTPWPGATCLRYWGEKHKHFLRTRYFKTSTPE